MAPEEFARIFLPLKGDLYRIARKLLASDEAAADAVQDVYLKLWDGRDSLDAVRNPSSSTEYPSRINLPSAMSAGASGSTARSSNERMSSSG